MLKCVSNVSKSEGRKHDIGNRKKVVVSKLTSKIRSTEKQVHKITAPIPSFIFNSGFILLLYLFIVIIILNVL